MKACGLTGWLCKELGAKDEGGTIGCAYPCKQLLILRSYHLQFVDVVWLIGFRQLRVGRAHRLFTWSKWKYTQHSSAQLKGHDTDVYKLHAECVSKYLRAYVHTYCTYVHLRVQCIHTHTCFTHAAYVYAAYVHAAYIQATYVHAAYILYMLHTCFTHAAYNTILSQVKRSTILSGMHYCTHSLESNGWLHSVHTGVKAWSAELHFYARHYSPDCIMEPSYHHGTSLCKITFPHFNKDTRTYFLYASTMTALIARLGVDKHWRKEGTSVKTSYSEAVKKLWCMATIVLINTFCVLVLIICNS